LAANAEILPQSKAAVAAVMADMVRKDRLDKDLLNMVISPFAFLVIVFRPRSMSRQGTRRLLSVVCCLLIKI
jgi:hypothetical protein